jgi:hypothetical protein
LLTQQLQQADERLQLLSAPFARIRDIAGPFIPFQTQEPIRFDL